jgi:TorA maturation chaperone TorD
MNTKEIPAESLAVDVARECLYRFLAGAVSDPQDPSWTFILEPDAQHLACRSAELLRESVKEEHREKETLGFGELPIEQLRLDELLAELRRPRPELQEEYDRVFGLVVNRECPPYETEYQQNAESFFRAQQLADIAGFYQAFGLVPRRASPERPDHLALELEFMAYLLLKKRIALASLPANACAAEQAQLCDDAQRLFFCDHLAWWTPSFVMGLRRKGSSGYYACVARVLAAFLPVERAYWGVVPSPVPLPVTLIEPPEEQPGCMACGEKS